MKRLLFLAVLTVLVPATAVRAETAVWPMRGVKAMLPARESFADFRTLIDLMRDFGYNTLMLELGGAMEYKSHPEVNEGWRDYAAFMNEYPGKGGKIQHSFDWNKNSVHSENGGGGVLAQAEISALAEYARQRGVEIIPEVPCLSHSDYLLWRHRDLAERTEDPYPDTYCPSDPKSYALLFDILDEVVALFRPRLVNIGHYEWYSIVLCEKCRGKDGARLYADDIVKIHGHLKTKGVRTMMWSEKLLDFRFCDSKNPWGGAARKGVPATWPAIDLLPKDILMLHWYWALGRNLENEFASRGYEWAFGNYSARQMLDWPGRTKKAGFRGYMLSNWGRLDLPTLQRNGILADLVMNRLVEESRDPDAEIDALWMKMFETLFDKAHPAGRNYCRIRHHATKPRDFRYFHDGNYIKREEWTLGRYELTLDDGQKVVQTVVYGENVSRADQDWNPPREWDTDARRGREALAEVAWSTLPRRIGAKTEYEIAVELPAGRRVTNCAFVPSKGLTADAVKWRLVAGE